MLNLQKGTGLLDENGIGYEIRDIKKDNTPRDESEQGYKISGLPLKRVFNTKGGRIFCAGKRIKSKKDMDFFALL